MSATKLTDYRAFPFLRKRLATVAATVAERPDGTVLWVGSGLSAKFARLPTWNAFLTGILSDHLSELGADDVDLIGGLIRSGRLSIAAECLSDRLGNRVVDRLAATFATSHAGAEVLSPLCAAELITTNYDTLLETALPWYRTVAPNDDIELLLAPGFKLVKIHGSVAQPSTCVLTLSSYVRAYNVNLRWYLANIFATRSVVFIGASMNAAEPFFRPLRAIRAARREHPTHFALLAVPDDATATREGKRLEDLGIQLLPYVPDAQHSLVDEFIRHLNRSTLKRSAVAARIKLSRRKVDAGATQEAAVLLWHLAVPHANASDRIALGDLASTFWSAVTNAPAAIDEYERNGTPLAELWLKLLAVIEPTRKVLSGVSSSLKWLEASSGRSLAGHQAMLATFQSRSP